MKRTKRIRARIRGTEEWVELTTADVPVVESRWVEVVIVPDVAGQ